MKSFAWFYCMWWDLRFVNFIHQKLDKIVAIKKNCAKKVHFEKKNGENWHIKEFRKTLKFFPTCYFVLEMQIQIGKKTITMNLVVWYKIDEIKVEYIFFREKYNT